MKRHYIILLFCITVMVNQSHAQRKQYGMTLGLGFENKATITDELVEETRQILERRFRAYGIDTSVYEIRTLGNQIEINFYPIIGSKKVKQLILSQGRIDIQSVYEVGESRNLIRKIEQIFIEEIRPDLSLEIFIKRYGFQQGTELWNSPKPLENTLKFSDHGIFILKEEKAWFKDLILDRQEKYFPKLPQLILQHSQSKPDELFFLKSTPFNLSEYLDSLYYEYNDFEQLVIRINLNEQGRQHLADITKMNLRKKLVLMLDQRVLTAPIVQEVITGGQLSIQGGDSPNINYKVLRSILAGGYFSNPLIFLSQGTYHRK